MTQSEVINNLRELGQLETDRFKKRAYNNAASAIAGLAEEDFNNDIDFTYITGIGRAINKKIIEMRDNNIVPAKLIELRNSSNINEDPSMYKVREGFTTKRIPIEQADEYVNTIRNIAERIHIDDIHFLGSYRRRKRYIADLDVLVTSYDDYKNLVEELSGFYEVILHGSKKTSYRINNEENTQIDVTWCPTDELPFALLHFTGSADHNVKMRKVAIAKGLKLSQHGLQDRNTKEFITGIENEQGIFEYLDVQFIEPENR